MAGEQWVKLTDTSGILHYVRVDTIDHVQDVAGTAHVQAGGTTFQVAGTAAALFNKIIGVDASVTAWAGFKYSRIATALPVVVKSGAGLLQRIIYGGLGAATSLTAFDGLDMTAPTILTMRWQVNNPAVMEVGAWFSTGLTIDTAALSDITVVYL